MNPLIHLKNVTLRFLALALVCPGPLLTVRAVNPTPDGSYFGANTAEGGPGALFSLTTGSNNTAIGSQALFSLTTGNRNTALGAQALRNNTSDNNTAIGFAALLNNTEGDANTAVGYQAMFHNTTGDDDTAIGQAALWSNTSGGGNSAFGRNALLNNTTGSGNTALSGSALLRNTTGDYNTAIGANSLWGVTTASNVTCIGANVFGANVSNATWIGNVYGVTTQNAITAPVIVSADGQFGTVASSERFKKDVATMDKASETILSLRPVTFHYKNDTTGTPQFGLIAEEVAKVNPALVLPDKEGKPYSVRYDQVNAMLLNEFLKEHRTVQELKSNAADQEATIARLEQQIEKLTAGLQKVSVQLQATNPASQVVNKDQ